MRVCNHVNDPCIESVKFPPQHCISEYFTDEHIQARTYHGLVLALLMQLFTYSATILVNTVYLSFTKNQVAFPVWLSALTCNDMTFLPVKTRPAKSNCHRQNEICFANLLDAFVLLRFRYHYHYYYYFI